MSGEKSEKPTERKIEKAREKGQVAERKNLIEALVITSTTFAIFAVAGTLSVSILQFFDDIMSSLHLPFDQVQATSRQGFSRVVSVVMIFGGVNGMIALFATLYVNKFNFAPQSLTPKFEKLNPISGLKGIFSLKTLYNFFRMLVYLVLISALTYFLVDGNYLEGLTLTYCGAPCFAEFFPALLRFLCFSVCAILLLLAVVDFRIQNALYTKQNKMTKDEVKRENKEANGNPEIEAERRSIAKSALENPPLKEATHVIHSDKGMIVLLRDPKYPDNPPFVLLKTTGTRPDLVERLKGWGAKSVNSSNLVDRMIEKVKVESFIGAELANEIVDLYELTGELEDPNEGSPTGL